MGWSNAVHVTDEGFHPRPADPWWNESSFISFRVPERELLGAIYFYFRPNQNTAMAGAWFADPSGDEMSTCLYDGWDWHLPIPEGADMFDFELENGFSVQTVETQHSYRHTYQADGCKFDLTFTADRRPCYMHSDPGEVNLGMSQFIQNVAEHATGHYEQSGVMNGTLQLGSEVIDVVDAAVIRDRSWGPRRTLRRDRKPRGAYLFARADRDHCFQAFAMSDLPWEEDPIIGTTERVVSGFYVKDGIEGRLVSGTRQVLSRSADGKPMHESITAVDEHGRTLKAEGRLVSALKWHSYLGGIMAYWCYHEWTLDGRPDVPGESQDWFANQHYSKWMRERVRATS